MSWNRKGMICDWRNRQVGDRNGLNSMSKSFQLQEYEHHGEKIKPTKILVIKTF